MPTHISCWDKPTHTPQNSHANKQNFHHNHQKTIVIRTLLIIAISVWILPFVMSCSSSKPTIKVGMTSLVQSLSPLESSENEFAIRLLPLFFETLTSQRKNGSLVWNMVAAPTLSKTRLFKGQKLYTYLFTLSPAFLPNAKFSDGTPLGAKEIVDSFNRLKNDPALGQVSGPIQKITLLSPTSFEMELSIPQKLLLPFLSKPIFSIFKQENKKENPIGSGLFAISKFSSEKIVAIKNTFHKNFATKNPLQVLEFYEIPSETQRIASFLAHQIDIVFDISRTSLDSQEFMTKMNAVGTLLQKQAPSFYILTINPTIPYATRTNIQNNLNINQTRQVMKNQGIPCLESSFALAQKRVNPTSFENFDIMTYPAPTRLKVATLLLSPFILEQVPQDEKNAKPQGIDPTYYADFLEKYASGDYKLALSTFTTENSCEFFFERLGQYLQAQKRQHPLSLRNPQIINTLLSLPSGQGHLSLAKKSLFNESIFLPIYRGESAIFISTQTKGVSYENTLVFE